MSQLGNLAIVCAQRSDVLLVISRGDAIITVGKGDGQTSHKADWRDNERLEYLIRELNFGSLRASS